MENKKFIHVCIEYSDNEGNYYTIKAPASKENYFRDTLAQLGYHIDNVSYYFKDYFDVSLDSK